MLYIDILNSGLSRSATETPLDRSGQIDLCALPDWPADRGEPRTIRDRIWSDGGQATTEYAMVLVVVAVIAVALFAVGPTGLRKVFDAVISFVVSKIPT